MCNTRDGRPQQHRQKNSSYAAVLSEIPGRCMPACQRLPDVSTRQILVNASEPKNVRFQSISTLLEDKSSRSEGWSQWPPLEGELLFN